MPQYINDHVSYACPHSFDFTPVNDDFVIKLIPHLDESKATGAGDISARLLIAADAIIPRIKQLINLSFSTGVYPDEWKHAKIYPLFKKSDRNLCANYHPISILCAVSKLIKRVAHQQLYD